MQLVAKRLSFYWVPHQKCTCSVLGQLFILNGNVLEEESTTIKNYLLNPVDSRFKDMESPLLEQEFSVSDSSIAKFQNFLKTIVLKTLRCTSVKLVWPWKWRIYYFIQDYFESIGEVPTETGLKVLDTYWSDHCRHTTFETELRTIDFSAFKIPKAIAGDI